MLEWINEQGPGLSLKYNKYYIGLQRDGVPDNFMTFRPRRKHLIMEARIERSEELDARLEDAGLTTIAYDKRWKNYRFQLVPADLRTHSDLIVDIIRMARGLPTAPLTDADAGLALHDTSRIQAEASR